MGKNRTLQSIHAYNNFNRGSFDESVHNNTVFSSMATKQMEEAQTVDQNARDRYKYS
jgi:hypothetical protein